MLNKLSRYITLQNVLIAAACLTLAVLIIRGIVMTRSQNESSEPNVVSAASRVLHVYNDETNIVEPMQIEDYLVGVVAGEMPASYDIEALKAQAVAARTYTLWRVSNHPCKSHNADICTDSKCCQAFRSDDDMHRIWGSSDYEVFAKKVRLAVESTRGETLYYGGEPIEALFHSSAGGRTESSENVYAAARPYLRSVSSPDGDELSAAETVFFEAKAFAGTVNAQYPSAGLSTKASKLKKQVEILSRFESGRVEAIALGGVTLTGREFRGLFELRSANFALDFTSKGVNVSTVGYGHGVGMSQRGADAMAKTGLDYASILLHYYTGAKLVRLW